MTDQTISALSMSLDYIEALYADYLNNPAKVPEEFQAWFGAVDAASTFERTPSRGATERSRPLLALQSSSMGVTPGAVRDAGVSAVSLLAKKQERLAQLVRAFREQGHLAAKLNPLGLEQPSIAELDPQTHGLLAEDLTKLFSASTVGGPDVLTLREILERLRNTYCRSIGVQFMHIADPEMRKFLELRMEETENRIALSRAEQLRILTHLSDAVIFEEFLQTKYIGAKVFSLEGSESLIPLLRFALDRAATLAVDEVVLAMAHRGRLNVLANVMGKAPRDIFREFEDREPEKNLGSGDVKYHLGFSSEYQTACGRKIQLSLCFNPSHLEYVNPVALGRVRARQDRASQQTRANKLAILIHGDAALAGEGIVPETLNLSNLAAYFTGGAVHIVINNQIGFTTTPEQGRSTVYATDVAKMLDIPIFHVNGEDPEAVAQVVDIALAFRAKFARDVFIDMYGYRRHGHNEGDEPTFTQPLLYDAIARRKSVRDGYLEHLLSLSGVTAEEAEQIAIERRNLLELHLADARRTDKNLAPNVVQLNKRDSLERGAERDASDTAVDKTKLSKLLVRLTKLPDGFRPHRKIERLFEQRQEMAAGERALDWGAGEALAFASLCEAGIPIRMTGQDCERGTFGHRHSAIADIANGTKYFPLSNLSDEQAPVQIHNSPLSESAVLGFEYGFSLDCPDWFVLWEAQFGDFGNVAQVIIDQFIVSGEAKWNQLSGLTLLLPHGYEGMGPEHSSARIERWLQLCANGNIQVCQPTTPAQIYHLFRRQAFARRKKPLIVFTPKSLLRHPKATSQLAELAEGRFAPILSDPLMNEEQKTRVRRVILCSGKVYYALEQRREELGIYDVAILRLEQIYPLGDEALVTALASFPPSAPVLWVQEEPENMGAWRYLQAEWGTQLLGTHGFGGVSRPASATPATGSSSSHRFEQERLLERAFAL